MNKYIDLIESSLDNYLEIKYPEKIYEAMRYSVLGGGKRIRAMITLLTSEALGCNHNNTLPFACAIEMIHAYSLIHDDLPAMDDDDLRRGKPTNHKIFGEAMAILAGDALLNRAFEIMSNFCVKNSEPQFIKAMNVISKASGANGMIGGQVMDILSEGQEINAEILEYIYKNKTSALFKASFCSGAYVTNASAEIIEKFELMADYFGISFQIKDDLLDIHSTEEVLGKPINSDEKNDKATYIKIHGLEKAEKDYLEYSEKTLQILESLDLCDTELYRYIKNAFERTY
ncbi:MAG: polyprenyl synthetase family protein [Defluviitaleaceae bacterium]|nr:polyprenyl synthetase family protein [Defluviitaleaceae bacterium]